jgi:hypothetical protein
MHRQACWNAFASCHVQTSRSSSRGESKSFEQTRPCRSPFAGLCQLRALAAFIATHLDAELVEKGNATAVHFRFLPKCLADLASIARDDPDHENRGRHFRLGSDYDRIRDLFGCCVDALGILSPPARSCDNGCRPCT